MKIKTLVAALMVASSGAFAAASVSTVFTGGTAVYSAPQDVGTSYVTCSVDTRAAAGSVATSTSRLLQAGRSEPVTVTAGQQISLKTNGGGPGKCFVNRITPSNPADALVVDDLTVSDDLTVTDDATVSGDLHVQGDAGVQGSLYLAKNLTANNIDAGFYKITVAECTGCGAFSGGGVPNATVFGSEVSAPAFDGGSYVGTTLNLSGSAVVGADLRAPVGKSYFGNMDLDAGAKFCLNPDCSDYVRRVNDGSPIDLVSGSGVGFRVSGGALVTNNTSISSFYNVTIGQGWGGTDSSAGTLIQRTGTGRENSARCDQRGDTTYPNVCNQVSGKGRIAAGAGAASFDINNGLMLSANGSCRAWYSNIDATCTTITCAADAGNMTFDVNGNCTADTDFDWAMESRQ